MTVEPPKSLLGTIRFSRAQLLQYDLGLAVLGGVASVVLQLKSASTFRALVPIAAGFVGVIIGAVIAGVAVLAALMDQAFLRKLRRINREPVRYIRPFVFTAVLGIIAAILLLAFVGVSAARPPTWVLSSLAGLTGLVVVWTLTSVIPDLGMLVEFMGLQFDAANVPDDAPKAGPKNDPAIRGVK